MSGAPLDPATVAFVDMVHRLTGSYLDAVAAAALEVDIERNQQRTAEQGPNWIHGPVRTFDWTPEIEPGRGPNRDKWMVRCSHCPRTAGVYLAVIGDIDGCVHHATEAAAQETAARHAAWHRARGW